MKRASQLALAAVILAAVVLVPAAPVSAARAASSPPASCGRASLAPLEKGADGSVPERREHLTGGYTPILLVHGWTGNPGMWSDKINLSTLNTVPHVNHSLLGNLQGLPGAAVYTLDYAKVAQKWFLDRGAGGQIFVDAEGCLTRHPAFAGHKMIVVAHSMGGLIVRWSVSDAAPDGPARRDRIGLVVTLGTPYTGSDIAAIGTALADTAVEVGVSVDKRFAAIAAVLHMLIALCHDADFVGCTQLNYVVDWLHAAHNFATGSEAMQALAPWPKGSRVETLGTRTVVGDVLGLFDIRGDDVDLGDVIVPVESATAGEFPEVVPSCHLTASAVKAGWDELMQMLGQASPLDAQTYWLFGLLGICFHSNQAHLIQLSNEVLGAVGDELARSDPGFAYANADGLVVVHGTRVIASYPKPPCPQYGGDILTDPTWTQDARFVTVVASGCYTGNSSNVANRRILALDTTSGATREIVCGCGNVAAVEGSRIAWVDQHGGAYTADLSSPSGPRALTVAMPAGLWPYEAVAGVDGTFLLHATRTPPGPAGYDYLDGYDGGVVAVVRRDGGVTVLRDYPNLESVMTAAGAMTPDGPRYAFTTLDATGDCGHPGDVWVSDAAGGQVTRTDTSAVGDGETFMLDAWWGYDGKLYATMMNNTCDPFGGQPSPSSLWRLDGNRWTQVDPGPLHQVRLLSPAVKVVTVDSGLYVEVNGASGIKIVSEARIGAPPPFPSPGPDRSGELDQFVGTYSWGCGDFYIDIELDKDLTGRMTTPTFKPNSMDGKPQVLKVHLELMQDRPTLVVDGVIERGYETPPPNGTGYEVALIDGGNAMNFDGMPVPREGHYDEYPC